MSETTEVKEVRLTDEHVSEGRALLKQAANLVKKRRETAQTLAVEEDLRAKRGLPSIVIAGDPVEGEIAQMIYGYWAGGRFHCTGVRTSTRWSVDLATESDGRPCSS